MSYMIIRHTVENFAKWKVVFDEHAATRREYGSKGGLLFRGSDNANEVVVILQWKDGAAAKAFSQSPALHEAMARAGVVGAPTVYFVEKVEDVPV